jgi:hypothetical protein
MRIAILNALAVALVGAGMATAQPSPLLKKALADQSGYGMFTDMIYDKAPAGTPGTPPAASPAPGAAAVAPDGAAGLPHATHGTSPSWVSAPSPKDAEGCQEAPAKGPRTWGSLENLFWWVKSGPLGVPLVSTGPPASRGILGNPGAAVVFGDGRLDYGELEGVRATAGAWVDDCHQLGVEADFFVLEQGTAGFSAASNGAGAPVLTIPVLNPPRDTPGGVTIASPGAFAGSVGLRNSTRLLGSELDGVLNVARTDTISIEALAGVRYLQLEERLGLSTTSTQLPGAQQSFLGRAVTAPSIGGFDDEFETRASFYGGELGLRMEYRWNRLTIDATGQVALGGVNDGMDIRGVTTLIQSNGKLLSAGGGLFAAASNSGHFGRATFSYVPELGLHVGYQVARHICVFAGYTFLYWDEVVRPGNQIDPVVSLNRFALSSTFGPPVRPQFPVLPYNHTDFWAQGADVGVGVAF